MPVVKLPKLELRCFRRQVDRLKNLFQAGGVRTQLAFISSCSSELSGNAFVEAGVPHVVAVKVKEAVAGKISMLRAFRGSSIWQ